MCFFLSLIFPTAVTRRSRRSRRRQGGKGEGGREVRKSRRTMRRRRRRARRRRKMSKGRSGEGGGGSGEKHRTSLRPDFSSVSFFCFSSFCFSSSYFLFLFLLLFLPVSSSFSSISSSTFSSCALEESASHDSFYSYNLARRQDIEEVTNKHAANYFPNLTVKNPDAVAPALSVAIPQLCVLFRGDFNCRFQDSPVLE
jgi:hypothetical protein